MSLIQLLPIGSVDGSVLENLRSRLTDVWQMPCEILPGGLDPEFAFHPERQQYHSTELLSRMRRSFIDSVQGLPGAPRATGCASSPVGWRLLGIASVDLYIPILTFVFGEAEIGNACAVVSLHRLRQEFYGLPTDPVVLQERLLKEAMHEFGHTLRLSHCDDYRCAMAPSHAVEWIDIKESTFCADCRARILAANHAT